MQLTINKETLKTQANVIRAFLRSGACEKCHTSMSITQSSAYTLLAMLYGYRGWNELSAALKEEEQNANP